MMDAWPCPAVAGVLADPISLFLSQALYMFYALAIVCDDFFVPSLEKICEVRGRDVGPFGKAWIRAWGGLTRGLSAPGQEGLARGALWR